MKPKTRKLQDLPIIGRLSGKLKVHFRKANNAYKKGNTQQAISEIVHMQRLDPNDANVNHLLAILLMNQQPAQVIFQYLNKAQTAAPEETIIRKTYIEFLIISGHVEEALKQQQFIVSKEKDNVEAWKQLLTLARKTDDTVSMLEASSMLLELGHEVIFNQDIEYSLLNTLASQYKSHIEKALIHVFSNKQVDLQHYMPHAASLLFAKYSDIEFCEKNIQQLNDDLLLNTFLTSGYNVHLPLELWLSKIRQIILCDISEMPVLNDTFRLVQSIAIQGYRTGYVILCGSEENKKLETLESRFARSNDANTLLLLSMYRTPTIQEIEKAKLLKHPSISDTFIKVLYQDQLVEIKYKHQINKANNITNATSIDVKNMYEESPFPQWSSIDFQVSSPAELASQLCLHSQQLYQDDNIDMLIAGCGTGRQSITAASKFKDIKVKAIDISSTSLAYALRKTREYQLDNIEYEQQDILSLVNTDKTYLLIESNGVLHHMEDPETAFGIIRSKLKPGGLMLIGLYSELARKHINEIREKAKRKGIKSDLNEIRRFRNDNLTDANSNFITKGGVFKHTDIGYLSGCRDLFFHVQEHQMSISWIKSVITKHNLTFKGFLFPSNSTLNEFKQQYSNAGDELNLDLWKKFEEDNPDTFINMYNFYCQCNIEI